MIRSVQEFFCLDGRCREVKLADGAHYPVLLSLVQMPGRAATGAAALRIQYRGHKEDLISLRCISRERLAAVRSGQYEEDPRGALLHVRSKPAPGRRGMLELSYITESRSVAAMLPGVRFYGADWLATLTARPPLRLVIDNTRREPHTPQAASAARPVQRASR